MYCNDSTSQNLIRNGSFEDHASLDCQSCHLRPENFAATMKSWRNLNTSNPFICDCNYKQNTNDERSGICDFEKVQPYDGCTMMEMVYSPSCWDFKHQTRGCASYLADYLEKPLEVGKIYEVSFWIYILPPYEDEYTKHIGISLFPDVIRNPNGAMLDESGFKLDTVIYNSWYQVKWYIRPLCKLQFLVIGTFRGNNGPPVNRKGNRNQYYVDQVSVVNIESDHGLSDPATAFCRYVKKDEEQLAPEIEGVNCFFEIGDSLISPSYKAALDSFAIRAKANPHASFIITGHTDSLGDNNTSLSMARVENVFRYLEESHQIPRERFISFGVGSKEPISSNKTREGRQLNRRVEIHQTDYGIDKVIYRNILEYIFNAKNEKAIKALFAWIHFAEEKDKMLMLFDPRLDVIKKGRKWESLKKLVKKSYSGYKQPELAYILDSLYAEDQKSRTLKYRIENLATYLYDKDEENTRWVVNFKNTTESETEKDKAHYDFLVKIIGENYYPKSSEIGDRPAKAVFLIINHSSDTTILMHYIPMIEDRCKQGEAEWLYYATMYDRLAILKGNPQRYGTQYRQVQGEAGEEKYELFPIEDSKNVNKLRKAIGLEPLEGFDQFSH